MKPTLSDLERIAREAGAILRDGYSKEHTISYKGVIDLVTETDHASEAFILKEIHTHFPDSHIIAEESGETQGTNGGVWYIDPLDGTVNYAHHVPAFCVSIAYAFDGIVILAAVYEPLRDEMFTAERGKGAYLNGKRIHASAVTELQKSLLVTGFPYDAWHTEKDNFKRFEKLGTADSRCAPTRFCRTGRLLRGRGPLRWLLGVVPQILGHRRLWIDRRRRRRDRLLDRRQSRLHLLPAIHPRRRAGDLSAGVGAVEVTLLNHVTLRERALRDRRVSHRLGRDPSLSLTSSRCSFGRATCLK